MSRYLVVPLLLLAACGESPTDAPALPPPVVWTASLELASLSLADPLVDETLDGLSDPTVRALVVEARGLAAARDVRSAAPLVTRALERLAAHAPEERAVEASVLQLVLQDVEARFRAALSTPSVSP